jgi:hypothetical protein
MKICNSFSKETGLERTPAGLKTFSPRNMAVGEHGDMEVPGLVVANPAAGFGMPLVAFACQPLKEPKKTPAQSITKIQKPKILPPTASFYQLLTGFNSF